MKLSAATAHFRQLCCLNAPSQMLMPSILQSLHDLIGSDSNAFYWSTTPGRITNAYSEEPMPRDIAALFYDEFLNNPKRPDSAIHLGTLMRPGQIVGNSTQLFPAAFYGTDNYNLIWRPLRRKALLWARFQDRNGNFHCITLRRLIRESPFSNQDEQRLAQLVPYLRYTLGADGYNNDENADQGESGLIIADEKGAVRYHSEQGKKLLLLAAHPTVSTGTVDWRMHDTLPMRIRQLCLRVYGISAGQHVSPPQAVIKNPWGEFVFRAHLLDAVANEQWLFGITIQHRVPLALKLMATMKLLNLSARQKEICLLLAQGKSHGAIATQLTVRATTVADHVQKIYYKLGVHNHSELLKRLRENNSDRSNIKAIH